MIVICAYFLKEGEQVLSLHPVLQVFIPEIEQTRQTLIESAPNPAHLSKQEALLRESLHALDARHDLLRRALFYLLETGAYLASTDPAKQRWRELQQQLFPTRLKIVNESFDKEAGEAIRIGELLLQPALKQELSSFTLSLGAETFSAAQLIQNLADVGLEMEALINQLAALEHQSKQPTAKNTRAEQQARLRFYRLLRALQQSASLALFEQPERLAFLFKTYEDELAKLDSKKKP